MSREAEAKGVSRKESSELHDYRVCIGLCFPIAVSVAGWLLVLLFPKAGDELPVLAWTVIVVILCGFGSSVLGLFYSILAMVLERSFGRKRCFLYCLCVCLLGIAFFIVGILTLVGIAVNSIW